MAIAKEKMAKDHASRMTVCIICGKERVGIPVKNDYIIEAIRWIKTNITKNEKNNRLVVCKECYPKYKKERDRFISRFAIYVGLGVVFVITGSLIGGFGALLYTLPVLLLLFLLSLLNYMPALDIETVRKKQAPMTAK